MSVNAVMVTGVQAGLLPSKVRIEYSQAATKTFMSGVDNLEDSYEDDVPRRTLIIFRSKD